MALTFPFALADFADLLPQHSVTLGLRRFDEYSGSGDGRFWSSSLARPLWQAEVTLEARPLIEAKRYAAMIDALDGARGSFLWADPSYYGASGGDPGGDVRVLGIAADRTGLSLAGLPEGFAIQPGDRLSIDLGSGSHYYGTFAQAAEADEDGETMVIGVMPYLPFGVATDDEIEMVRPVLRMMIPPGGYTGYTVRRANRAEGASIRMLQRP